MTVPVLVDSQQFANGPRVQSRGTIKCRPYALVVGADHFVNTAAFIAEYPGEAVTLQLEELPDGNAWYVELEVDGQVIKRLVAPAGTDPVNLAALPNLDPKTLTPAADQMPAWVAGLAGVNDRLDDVDGVFAGRLSPASLTAKTRVDVRPGIANVVPLTAYGNSYFGAANTSTSNTFNRLRKRLGSKTWNNLAVNSSRTADCCSFAYGSTALTRQGTLANEEDAVSGVGTWTPSTVPRGIVLLDMVGGDAHYDGIVASGGTTAKSRAGFVNGLDALIRLLRASSVRNDNDASITYAGTWTDSTPSPNSYGNRSKDTSQIGATMTFTARNGDALVLIGYDFSGSSVPGSAWTLTADGQPYATGTTNDTQRRTGGPINAGFGQVAVPISGLSAGDHTFVLTKNGTSGQHLTVDCILRESVAPPTILIIKKLKLAPAAYAEIIALGGLTASLATDDIYNGLLDTVVARFPADGSVITWDPNLAGFDPATMIGTRDGFHVHKNDLGDDFCADKLFDVINALPPRDGMVTVI